MGQPFLCKSILYFSSRFLGAWALIHTSPGFSMLGRGFSFHCHTWELDAEFSFLSRLPTWHSIIPWAVWYTRIQHERLIHARAFRYQTHWHRFRQHSFFSWFFFLASTSSTWFRVFLNWKKKLQENNEKLMTLLGFEVRSFCACDNVIHSRQFINFSVMVSLRFGVGVGAMGFLARSISRHLITDLFSTWSKLILSNNPSSATLRVWDTCLIVGLLPLISILITAVVS